MGKLYEYTTALYRALDAAAATETIDGARLLVFRGGIVRVYRGLNIPQSRYTEVRRGLIETGSITILQVGARNSESVIALHGEPDEESINAVESFALTNGAEPDTLTQELKDLRRLIGSINIPDALVNIERRLQELDNRITIIEQHQTQTKGDKK